MQVAGEIARRVGGRVNGGTGFFIIANFHDVKEIVRRRVPPDVENVHQAWMRPGDRREFLETAKLPVVRISMIKDCAPDYFDGVETSQNIARQPHVAVSAPAHELQQFVIGNRGGTLRGGSDSGRQGAALRRRHIVPQVRQRRLQPVFFLFQMPPLPAQRPGERAGNLHQRRHGPVEPKVAVEK